MVRRNTCVGFFTGKNAILNILTLAAVLFVAYYVYKFFTQVSREGFRKVTSKMGQEPVCILFHLNGCGHCQRFMPEWDKFSDQAKQLKLIKTLKVEGGTKDPLIKKFNIKGYPTICVARGGKKLATFTGDRHSSALFKWIKNLKL